MTVWKRMLVLVVLACLVMTFFPVSASAIDPVSAATMANALAQAITAYGASQGVSMTFDVTNTDGIGEGVKELWDNFKADMESDPDYSGPTIQTYDSMSVSTWAKLYKKMGNKVSIDLTAEVKSAFDGFWNWLLSGPAEMSKVDDQYYQWSLNQDNTVTPIDVYTISSVTINGRNATFASGSYLAGYRDDVYTNFVGNIYVYKNSSKNSITFFTNDHSATMQYVGSINQTYSWGSRTTYNGYASYVGYVASSSIFNQYSAVTGTVDWIEYYGLVQDGNDIPSNIQTNNVSVQPYIGDTVPQDVYIPDNQDVNYEPIPVEIPLDVNWDDSIYGDGTDTLTDAQAQEIADALDTAITENPAKTLELADTDTPIPEPGEVYIPFLPVELPSFNFNFSGIWHYVVEWISSLGAWFSMVLTVWNNLPYAMTVPVYACLVILIVLGVYRRFLS